MTINRKHTNARHFPQFY